MISLAATFVLAALVIGAAGWLVAGRVGQPARPLPSPSPRALRWEPNACVRDDGLRFELAPCERAESKVIVMAGDPPGLGDCPDDTDDVLRVGRGRTACVRSLADPHFGAPGAGGGVLRAGDCLARDGLERPCAATGWYGRTLAVVATAATCPAATVDALTLDDRQTACLEAGGQVLAEGMCLARPTQRVVARSTLAPVPCASPSAWARVWSFEKTGVRCPAGAGSYLKATGAFRPVTCLSVLAD